MIKELTYCGGTLHRVNSDGEVLRLEFNNGYTFRADCEDAIMEIAIRGSADLPSVRKQLLELRGEEVDGIAVETLENGKKLMIDFCWANDGETYSLIADEVESWQRGYQTDDYREHIKLIEMRWAEDRQKLSSVLDQTRSLSSDLEEQVTRLTRKSTFFEGRDTTKVAVLAAQVETLLDMIEGLKKLEKER